MPGSSPSRIQGYPQDGWRGERDDTGLIMDWNLMVRGWTIEKKEERKRLIFLGLHRKPIKSLTRDLLCSQRPQAPSRWGEDTERFLDWVLEAQAKKWTKRASVLQGISLKKKRRKRERKTQRGELWWNGIHSFIFKRSFYALSYTFPEVKDTKSCRVSSTLHQFHLLWDQDVFCIPFHLQGPLCYVGEGNGTPLQYCCLENPMDGGAW